MIERWSHWVCSEPVLWAWVSLAFVIFLVLFKVTAPYGRHARHGWGPLVPSWLGWFLMEFVTLVGMGLCFWVSASPSSGAILLGALYLAHYTYRSVLYPWLASTSSTPVSLSIVLSAFFFNVFNSTILGGWIFIVSSPGPVEVSANWVVGLLLFAGGFVTHVRSDTILRNLRRDHGPGYHIPRGFLYRWVSCPNYLGEITQWVGFAVMINSLAGWTFAVWTMANLLPRAVEHHRWYTERFPDYPERRRAIVPGII